MINFSVKPSSYTGASDTNGGGYVDGYDATYANFCTANGGPLYTNIEPTTYGYDSTGLYDITHSMTVPTGVICYCRYADDSASTTLYFYAYLVNTDNWQMVYLPVGKTGISSQAVIDDAISNAEAGDELLLLAVGGALASIEQAKILNLAGYIILIEQGTYLEPALEFTVDTIIDVVNSSGASYRKGESKAILMPIASGQEYLIKTSGDYIDLTANGIEIDCTYDGGTNATYGMSSSSTSTHYSTWHLRNIAVKNATSHGIYIFGRMDGDWLDVNANNNGGCGIFLNFAYSQPNLINCYTCFNTSHGIWDDAAAVNMTNCLSAGNGGYGLITDLSATGNIISCTFVGNSAGDIYIDAYSTATSSKKLFYSVVGTVTTIGSRYIDAHGSVIYGTITGVVNQYNCTNNDPELDTNYRPVSTATYFADVYNNTTGELVGALGPVLPTGTGGTGVCNLIGNGGMIE